MGEGRLVLLRRKFLASDPLSLAVFVARQNGPSRENAFQAIRLPRNDPRTTCLRPAPSFAAQLDRMPPMPRTSLRPARVRL